MMNKATMLTALIALTAILSSCDSGFPGVDASRYREWEATGELIFGHLDDPVYSFGPVGAMTIGPGEAIYTAHPQELLIRRWKADGELDRVFGGRGEGPGEFRALISIGLFGDTLWAIDSRGSRVTYFREDGEVIRTVPLRIDTRAQADDPYAGHPRPVDALPDGTFYGIQSSVFPQIAGRDSTLVLHLHVDADTRVLDTLYVQPMRRTDVLAVRSPHGEWLTGAQTFADGPLTAVEPTLGAFVVVERPAYRGKGPATSRLLRISMAGDTVFQRTVPYEPIPLDAATVDRVVANLVTQWEKTAESQDSQVEAGLTDLARAGLYTPDYYPPFSQVVMGRDGTIWLRGVLPQKGQVEWRVLDDEGRPLARASLPTAFRVLVAERGKVWGVERDRSGVEYVRRFRLDPSTDAAGG